MSKDIRSFFSVLSKKSNTTAQEPKKKVKRLIDSDDEDVISATPEKNTKPINKGKIKPPTILVDSSDSEGESIERKPVKQEQKPKLTLVNLDDVFGNKPIKQSKVESRPKGEIVKQDERKTPKSKKKRVKTEIGIHGDEAFEKTLMELDDDLLIENLDVLDKTIDEALNSNKEKKSEVREGSSKENSPKKPVDCDKPEKGSKRQRLPSEGTSSTPKKHKFEHTDSGLDPDEEAHEKRRYSAMLYQKYKNRAGPKMHGQKEPPKGNPDCLKNLTFLRTGVLDSLESEEFDNIVAEHGGRAVKSVSKKVNYIVVGEDPGPSKLEKAKGYGIKELNENEFFDLILVKSGKQPKYVVKTQDSQDSGVFEDQENEKKLKITHAKEIKQTKQEEKRSLSEKKKHASSKEESSNYEKPDIKKLKTETKVSPKEKQAEEKLPKVKKEDSSKSNSEKIVKLEEKPTKLVEKSVTEEKSKIKTETQSKASEETKTISPSVDPSLPWTEKYKPTNINNIIGQQGDSSILAKLRKWLNNWYRNQIPEVRKKIPMPSPFARGGDGAYYKAALLSGPPGVGKTTTATLLSKELGFDVVELNASDTRSKKLLQEEVSQLLKTTTIAGFAAGNPTTHKKRVLLMDEVDGMAGNEDRGGMQELINLIKHTSVPIICMCNNKSLQKMKSLTNYCFDLVVNPPRVDQIRGAMMSICFKEGLNLPPNVISEIIAGTGCDIRQTLNHLTMYAASNSHSSLEEVQNKCKESKKDTILGPWEVIRCVFTDTEQKRSLADKSKLFFYDYSLGPLFVQENYLGVTPNCPKKGILKRVAQAADAMCIGDLVDAKIRSSNNWALLECQAMYASVLPGYYMSGKITSRINFPRWLGKNSSRNKRKRLLNELHAHTRTSISGGALALKLDYLLPLRNAIISPILKEGLDGIATSVNAMQQYNLLREDMNNLIELCQWKDSINPYNKVDPKVKAAFTRAYNKSVQKLPFAAGAGFSKKKASRADYDDEDDENVAESDNEENDDVNADTLIKVKSRTKDEAAGTSKKGKAKAAAGSSKQKDSAKGKGKTKKT